MVCSERGLPETFERGKKAADLPTIQSRLSHFQVAHFSRGHGSVRVVLLDESLFRLLPEALRRRVEEREAPVFVPVP